MDAVKLIKPSVPPWHRPFGKYFIEEAIRALPRHLVASAYDSDIVTHSFPFTRVSGTFKQNPSVLNLIEIFSKINKTATMDTILF